MVVWTWTSYITFSRCSGAQSLKSRCRQGWFLLGALKETVHASLPAPGSCRQSLAFLGLWLPYSELHLLCHTCFFSVSRFQNHLFLVETPVTGLGAKVIQYDLISTWLKWQKPNFQIKSHSQVQGVGLEHIFLGDTMQPTPVINKIKPWKYFH